MWSKREYSGVERIQDRGRTMEETFQKLEKIITQRLKENSKDSYVASLKAKNWNKVLEKIIEEAGELVLALKDWDKKEIISEFADLFFHSLVALNIKNIFMKDIQKELSKRFDKGGILEKKLRWKDIVVIDYGSGNIRSVESCLNRLWVDFKTTSDREEIESSDLVIFPWVWNAKYAMRQLENLDLAGVIRNYKNPFLWICLWMQLLLKSQKSEMLRLCELLSEK